ncbi:MAG TPA: iron-sulfur cluster repair di-iron protein, ric [Firmicutes bacterium]|jgi:iron-sulfur cluster repair protein YtfE (RIC family)|nr:MAG: iron-sulfur cluster repair di-iron protein, ric [Peptococcaceae bacterium 1109]HHT74147.1 iron-sulfur cluster repair di-iron protein, ric [Bacillota bacterium]
MARFTEALARNLATLEQYVPIVARVHGGTHPEFHHVRRIFDALNEKIKAEGTNRPDLAAEFSELRKITQDYTVPGDVCETYAAVYNMLAELDEAYHA